MQKNTETSVSPPVEERKTLQRTTSRTEGIVPDFLDLLLLSSEEAGKRGKRAGSAVLDTLASGAEQAKLRHTRVRRSTQRFHYRSLVDSGGGAGDGGGWKTG